MKLIRSLMRPWFPLALKPPNDPWFGDLTLRRAVVTSVLLADEPRWVHRRVERLTFLDGKRIERSMSIDFTLPNMTDDGDSIHWSEPALVPIAIPLKRLLRDFDLRDESGSAVPILTRDENSSISAAFLYTQALEVMTDAGYGDLLSPVVLDLHDVVGARRSVDDRPSDREREERTRRALRRFRVAARVAPADGTQVQQQRGALWIDRTMQAQIRLLADRYVLFALLPGDPNRRRILKMSNEEMAMGRNGGEGRRVRQACGALAARLGWNYLTMQVAVRAIFGAESYHAEVLIPDELVIKRAVLARSFETWNSETDARSFSRAVLSTDINVDLAHVYFSGVEPDPPSAVLGIEVETSEAGFVEVDLSLKPGVILPPAIITALTAGMLWTGVAMHAASLHSAPDSVIVLLIALPAVFAAYLVPGEHRLVRQLFRPLRAMIFGSAAVAFVAAALLALNLSPAAIRNSWIALAALATVAAFVVVGGLMTSRRLLAVDEPSGVGV